MTDPTKLLALARAAMPDMDFCLIKSETFGDYIQSSRTFLAFVPENDSDQALALLCWLGTQTDFSVRDDGRDFMLWDKHDDLLLSEPYSTPAEWRAAVRKAAMRVA